MAEISEVDVLSDMSEEQLLMLLADPMARSMNDYGGGAGWLGEDSTPDEWKRMGDRNKLIMDTLKSAGLYLEDFLPPELREEPEAPGAYQGYRSDVADLYRNNPAYDMIQAQVAEGVPFEEAVNNVTVLASEDPTLMAALPVDEGGQVDRIAFRNSAQTFVSEAAREGREFGQWQTQQDAYDQHVTPLSYEDQRPTGVVAPRVTGPGGVTGPSGVGGPEVLGNAGTSFGKSAAGPLGIGLGLSASGKFESGPRPIIAPDYVTQSGTRVRPPQFSVNRSGNREGRGTVSPSYSNVDSQGRTGSQVEFGRNKVYNETASMVADTMRGMKQQQVAPSREQQRQAAVLEMLNRLRYGGDF